ncbi:MAG: AAA family ATPase [Firmicutes bacterium]|nr:AAA family ATPase [Bacillota bacterium]
MKEHILEALNLLYEPGDVVELRVLDTAKKTVSGYFDDFDKLADEAVRWDGKAPAVYVTLNPVNPALLARASNKAVAGARQATSDSDILCRRWLPVDIDPKRPAGISSSEEEHNLAHEKAFEVADFLYALGWPPPVYADSGNGAHLLYPVDSMPNDRATAVLFEAGLKVLDLFYSDQRVSIDHKVFNAARIWKLYGTMAAKGENLPDRPHRVSRIITAGERDNVTRVQMEALAAMLPRCRPGSPGPDRARNQGFDLEDWIHRHGLPVVREKPWENGGRLWVLNPCPWNSGHTNGAAFIAQGPDGAIGAKCHHNGCSGKGWRDLRDIYEPGWRERRKTDPALSRRRTESRVSDSGQTPLTPRLIRASEVETADIEWLWEPYLPKGKITFLDGNPGEGKTFLALNIAAMVSTGAAFPAQPGRTGIGREPANALFLNSEDGVADTLVPRLIKAGADLSRVMILSGKSNENQEREPFTLADTRILRAAMEEVEPVLLIIDPIQAYIGARVDINRANEVRSVMNRLVIIGEEFNCAVLCIRHLSKGRQEKAIFRGMGSIDFSAVARSILIAGIDQNTGKRILTHAKSSLAPLGKSIHYEISESGFTWGNISDMNADDLFEPPAEQKESRAIEEAKTFLWEQLKYGPVKSEQIFRLANETGISSTTLKRAKAEMGIRAQKEKGAGGNWIWEIPVGALDELGDIVHGQ